MNAVGRFLRSQGVLVALALQMNGVLMLLQGEAHTAGGRL